MITEELAVQLRPATPHDDGTYRARTYPLAIFARPGWRRVQLLGIEIVPRVGVVELWAGSGGGQRKATTNDGSGGLPSAEATEGQSLHLTLINLSPDDATVVNVRFLATPLSGHGGQSGDGNIVRWEGAEPLGGTDAQEDAGSLADQDGSTAVHAMGASFESYLTTDGPIVSRTIRQVTSQVRILAPAGFGDIPTTEVDIVAITVKQDNAVLDAAVTTIDFLSAMFALTSSPSGEVNVTGFAAGAVDAAALAAGAVTEGKIDNGAVTSAKIAAAAIIAGKIAAGIIVNADISAAAAIDQSKIDGLVSALAAKQAVSADYRTQIQDAEYDAVALGNKSVTSTVGAIVTGWAEATIVMPNDGLNYDMFAWAGASLDANTADYIWIACAIDNGGGYTTGGYIRTGTVGGERWKNVSHIRGTTAGTGQTIKATLFGKVGSGTGLVQSGSVQLVAIPRV